MLNFGSKPRKKACEESVMTKNVGYLRVSKMGQDLDKNKADILLLANKQGLGVVSFVEDVVSGKKTWRERKIAGIINDLEKGDSLIVSELSRIGRSMLEIMEILSLAMQKGVKVFSVKGGWHLDDSLQSKVTAMAFSIAAEIERELISERTKEALRARKAKGLPLGRPKGPGKSKLDYFKPEIEALLANGSTQKFIATRYQTTEANLHLWMKKHKLLREK